MLSQIKTNLSQKLKDKAYRTKFFHGRAQDEIAYQLRAARKKRKVTQPKLERLSGMKQSAISRIEQASYSRWNFKTLLRIAEALDLRVRVEFDYAEDVIREYERLEGVGQASMYADNATASQAAMDSRSTEAAFLTAGITPTANVAARVVSGPVQ